MNISDLKYSIMGHLYRCGEQFSDTRGWLRQCKASQKIFATVFLILAIVCFSNKTASEIVQQCFLVKYGSSNWKRLRTTELDNCLDLCWQLWFSRIIGLKSISTDLTSLAVFVIDAYHGGQEPWWYHPHQSLRKAVISRILPQFENISEEWKQWNSCMAKTINLAIYHIL